MTDRAQISYQALWVSGKMEEKAMILDYCSDEIVNAKDRDTFPSLARKGIINVTDAAPRLMNQGMVHYIFGTVREEIPLEVIAKIGKGGAWNQIRIPLLLIIVSVGAFILTTQKQVLDNSTAVITALIPILRQILLNMGNISKTIGGLSLRKGKKAGGEEG